MTNALKSWVLMQFYPIEGFSLRISFHSLINDRIKHSWNEPGCPMRPMRISMRAPKWMCSAGKYDWSIMRMRRRGECWPIAGKSKNLAYSHVIRPINLSFSFQNILHHQIGRDQTNGRCFENSQRTRVHRCQLCDGRNRYRHLWRTHGKWESLRTDSGWGCDRFGIGCVRCCAALTKAIGWDFEMLFNFQCKSVSENLLISVSHNCTEGGGDATTTKHGIDLFREAVYGSPSVAIVSRDLELFFGTSAVSRPPKLVASYDLTTLAIVKPHAIQAGHLVDIIADITSNGFIITGMRMLEMGRENCEEFYEVYKGVVSEYLVINFLLILRTFIWY